MFSPKTAEKEANVACGNSGSFIGYLAGVVREECNVRLVPSELCRLWNVHLKNIRIIVHAAKACH